MRTVYGAPRLGDVLDVSPRRVRRSSKDVVILTMPRSRWLFTDSRAGGDE